MLENLINSAHPAAQQHPFFSKSLMKACTPDNPTPTKDSSYPA
jgi:hypothetical protein